MSVEKTRLEDIGSTLGEAIVETPTYEKFTDAKKAVEESDEAQEKIGEFNQLRQEFMLAQKVGEATNEDVTKVQTAQQELHEIPVMATYLEAQSELAAKLQAVNEAISEPLALDFADEAGGCCHD